MKKIFRILVICLLLSFIWFLCSSCGARKAESTKIKESAKAEFSDKSKSEQAEQIESKSETNVKKSEHIIISDNNQSQTIIETVEPIDPTKPATYKDKNGNIQELNNAKATIQTIIQKNNTKTDAQAKTESLVKSENKTNKKGSENKDIKAKVAAKNIAETKHVDREAWSIWNIFWLLIPAALLYFVWRNRVSIIKKITGVWWV